MAPNTESLLIAVAFALILTQLSCEEVPEECKAVAHGSQKEPCCDLPDMEDFEGEKGTILKECFVKASNYSNPDTYEPNLIVDECITECYFNRSGLLNHDNSFIVDRAVEDFLSDFERTDPWYSIADAAINDCIRLPPTQLKEDSKCTSGAHQLFMCALKEMYKNCPEKKWTDTEACTTERSLIDQCAEYIIS